MAAQASTDRPVVIGIYGIPGSGKSHLLRQLKHELDDSEFSLQEGSDLIASLVPGGLDGFLALNEVDRIHWREQAITSAAKESARSGRTAVVAGHLMLWDDQKGGPLSVHTKADTETYTHILYLDVSADDVARQRQHDAARTRPHHPTEDLRQWQREEKTLLRTLCRDHGILFSTIRQRDDDADSLVSHTSTLLREFRLHTQDRNMLRAEAELDRAVAAAGGKQIETMLVLDADKTLSTADSGLLFCKEAAGGGDDHDKNPFKALFSSSLGYSYMAFRQAALLYDEMVGGDATKLEALCHDVAAQIALRPEFIALLDEAADSAHVGTLVITCGLARVWELVVEGHSYVSTGPAVIGGTGRLAIGEQGIVVTPAIKAALVRRLRRTHGVRVWAFGDSPLDIPMLSAADRAVVVVGDGEARSTTMDAVLEAAITYGSLVGARQALVPSSAAPRLDTTRLPVIRLSDPEVVGEISRQRLRVWDATDKTATRLLATPMRDASVYGPALREAHRLAGRYLAMELVPDAAGGLEEFATVHVQGRSTAGFRLYAERRALIVALMRGGEPMALGVSDTFPRATFLHAKDPSDLRSEHLEDANAILLVDSVVNTGRSAAEFVAHIRRIEEEEEYGIHSRIVVVTGVAHSGSVSPGSPLARAAADHGNVSLVALRLSDNRFTGSGTTDTGNRLFNTTHIL